MINAVPYVEKVASLFSLIHNEPSKPGFAKISLSEQLENFITKFCFKKKWQNCTKLINLRLDVLE